MRKDHPLRMINAGRYKVCFAELSLEIQDDVLKRMARLIDENREWYDRGNYGHLCNILPTLAIDEALQAAGKSPEDVGVTVKIYVGIIEARKDAAVGRKELFRAVDEDCGALGVQDGFGQGLAICVAQGHRRPQRVPFRVYRMPLQAHLHEIRRD